MRSVFFWIVILIMLAGCALPLPGDTSPAVPSGSVLYQDDFSSSSSGWDRVMHEGGIMDYDGSGFRILVSAPQANLWSTPKRHFERRMVM